MCVHAEKSFKTAYGTLLATAAISNGLIAIAAVVLSFKGFSDTYKCYLQRQSKREENDKKAIEKFAYKDIKLGEGEGCVKLGTSMELGENLYSLAFVSLIRQEYVDACVIEHEKEKKEKSKEKMLELKQMNAANPPGITEEVKQVEV